MTSEQALWLDGNAIGGMLAEVFGTDMTSAMRGCQSCGAREPVAAHRAYRGAGMVLRCPSCSDVAMRVAVLPDRHVVQVSGTWTMEMPSR